VLWTLYVSFAYLIYAIVILLVVGWQRMGPLEWTGAAGGPVVIYATRKGLTAFYAWRVTAVEKRLKEQTAERAKTIQKLKDATRYDTTQQLLEKYGGAENKSKKKKVAEEEEPTKGRQSLGPGGRTGIAPPATANIQRQFAGSAPGTPQPRTSSRLGTPQRPVDLAPTADFAPNAFSPSTPPPSQYEAPGESHWYERVLDLLLGEDEQASKNRIVLICKNCRLVNGQAPPGTKTLAEVGQWKCMSCGTMNGEVDEGQRIVREVLAQAPAVEVKGDGAGASHGADTDDESAELVEAEREDSDQAEMIPAGPDVLEESMGARKRKGRGRK
jgi:endoplasmic reticulum junction formation protein lunapark